MVNILCILQNEVLTLKRLAQLHFIRGGNCWCSSLNLPRNFLRGKNNSSDLDFMAAEVFIHTDWVHSCHCYVIKKSIILESV